MARARQNLALGLYRQDRFAEAEGLLAERLREAGRPAEAEPRYREVLAVRTKARGPEHPDPLRAHSQAARRPFD